MAIHPLKQPCGGYHEPGSCGYCKWILEEAIKAAVDRVDIRAILSGEEETVPEILPMCLLCGFAFYGKEGEICNDCEDKLPRVLSVAALRARAEKAEAEAKRLREAGDWFANHLLQYRVSTPEYQDARLLVDEYDRRRRAKEG